MQNITLERKTANNFGTIAYDDGNAIIAYEFVKQWIIKCAYKIVALFYIHVINRTISILSLVCLKL